jgi:hypothetical protein
MRRRSVVAIAALIAAFALAGLPVPAGSRSPTAVTAPAPAAFSDVAIPADAQALAAAGSATDSARSDGYLEADAAFADTGAGAPAAIPSARPRVDQPQAPAGEAWKPAKQVLRGQATFYDFGTTAMRLPRGTHVRICGAGGCIERVVTDYGPQKKSRVVDLYRPDFFAICGCGSWSGVTDVVVYVY